MNVTDNLLTKVRTLMSEGKGDRVIAETLDITRHEARKLIREVELADAKQGSAAAPMPAVLSDDPDAWALLINGAFRRSYDSIIEAGKLLIAAKEKLGPRGTWLEMVETKLDFSPDTAQRLMSIARDERLTNTAHVRFLPRSYSTLHELTKLSDEEFARGIEQNIIRPDMERKDVEIIRPTPHRERPEPDAGAHPREGYDATVGPEHHGPADIQSQHQEEDRPARPDPLPPQADVGEPSQVSTLSSAESDPDREAGFSDGSPASVQMPSGGLAIAHRRDETDTDPREFFPTPPWATRALIERVLRHLRREGQCQFQTAWEPACGEGHMAEVLREYFRAVEASDAFAYQYRGDASLTFQFDFLKDEGAEKYDWIITNPPFRKSTDFVLKALDLAGTGVAMFVRLSWIEGVTRYEKLLRDQPPSLLSIFTERAPLHKARWEPEGSTFTAYAWLVWIKGMPPQPPFWIPPGCRHALAKSDDVKRFGKTEVEEGEAA